MRGMALAGYLAVVLSVFSGNMLPSPLQGQETITVFGQIVNGTQGASVPMGTTVQLHAFSQGTGALETTETTTDESGDFRFEDVLPNGDIGYAITTDYGGMPYTTLIGPEDVPNPVDLVVYEPTQDLSVISVNHHALVIINVSEADQLIEAVEIITLSNNGDRTLIPDLSNVGQGQFSFMRFSLPAGAGEFDIQSDLVGGQVIPVDTGFGLTAPITPGEHSLNFTFKFPYQGNSFAYQQNLLQGADVYQVLIPQRFGQIQVGNLEPMPDIDVGDLVYGVWEGQDFAPGQGVTVELTSLPQPSLLARMGQTVTSGPFWHRAIPISLGATLALVLVYVGFRSPRMAPANGVGLLPRTSSGTRNHQALVREIALLDQRFQSGQVPEDEYQSQRTSLKDRILEAATPVGDSSDRGG